MLNRKIQPEFKTLDKLVMSQAKEIKLSNGIPFYAVNSGEQDVVRIDFIFFNSGSVYSENPLIPEAANSLIEAGSLNMTSAKTAEELDFYGAYLDLYVGMHTGQIILYTLNKYLDKTLKIVSEMIFHAVYPQNEVEIFLQNKFQNFLISRQKTEVLSKELFTEVIFGKSHPYGRIIKKEDFENIDSNILSDFFQKHYTLHNLKIIMSGKVSELQLKTLDDYFGNKEVICMPENNEIDYTIIHPEQRVYFKELDNTVQSSLRIGKITINKHHPDFFKLNITGIIFGGYFGSRLMTNIREDKGYTYGIYAGNLSLINAGIFTISAESGKDVYQKAIDEIYKELKILRTEFVSGEELERVKNWLIGSLAKTFDGPFAPADAFKSILTYNQTYDYFDNYFDTVKTITPDIIRATAEKYLHEDSMYQVVARSK